MASGVFGIPISEATVRATGKYAEPITQKDVADYTMKSITDNKKDIDAQTFVDNLKLKYGDGISTKCLIYNATGTILELVTNNDFSGHVGATPYPSDIQNGQWGAFLHVKTSGLAVGSAGAVVYRTKVPPDNNSSCDWLFSWSVPYIGDNKMKYIPDPKADPRIEVYTEIREEGHFPEHWDYIYNVKLLNSGYNSTDQGYGYVSNTDIGEGSSVDARATFKLPY